MMRYNRAILSSLLQLWHAIIFYIAAPLRVVVGTLAVRQDRSPLGCETIETMPVNFRTTSCTEPSTSMALKRSVGRLSGGSALQRKCLQLKLISLPSSALSTMGTISLLVDREPSAGKIHLSKTLLMLSAKGKGLPILMSGSGLLQRCLHGLMAILSSIKLMLRVETKPIARQNAAQMRRKNNGVFLLKTLSACVKSERADAKATLTIQISRSVSADLLVGGHSMFARMVSSSVGLKLSRAVLALLACCLATSASVSTASEITRTATPSAIPKNAPALLPILIEKQREIWPDAPIPSFLAGQVEQESCISLSHSKCWSVYAELKTSREYGFGLLQATTAYRADGSIRFDKRAELQREFVSLKGWTYENRFDAKYQLTALVEMDRGIYRRVAGAASSNERLAFTLSAYNGGESGVRQDRLLCGNTLACDRNKWFGNVEKYSLKTRKVNPGYGHSAFDINREYVRNVIYVRRPKYEPFFQQ